MQVVLVKFEDIPMRGFFLHNNISYKKISRSYAEKYMGLYEPDRAHYFDWAVEVQPNNYN